MPIYQCISPEGLLDESQRKNIARAITRIHCDATGAPRSFVNVLFQDMPNGRVFTGRRHRAVESRHGRRVEICRKCGHGSLTSQRGRFSSRCGKSKPKMRSKPA